MKDYGRVRSTISPKPMVIDEFSVWIHKNITEVSENVGEENEFIGYEYDMIQYEKDQYISKLTNEDDAGMLALLVSLLMTEVDMLKSMVMGGNE